MTHGAKGTTRWMDPELLDPEDDSRAIPSKQSDVYSFGSIMLQVCMSAFIIDFHYWNHGKTLTGCVPYHDLHDQQVVLTIARGMQPRRPDKEVVTDHRWRFIQRCWSPTDLPESRPSSDEIVKFTEKELVEALAPEINALIDSIQFSFHHDLTGCVISSGSYPFASGGLGDIYRGRLNIEGRLIDVRHRLFFLEKTEQPLGCYQDTSGAPPGRGTSGEDDKGVS